MRIAAEPFIRARTHLPTWLGLTSLVGVIGVLVVAPLMTIAVRAVIDPTTRSWAPHARHLVTVLTGSIYWTSLASTVAVAIGAALLACVLGTALAWIFARTTTFGRSVLEQIAQLPIFIPPFVGAVAWALLLAPRVGIINRILPALGISIELDLYSHAGMAWVMGIYLAPYVMMIVAAALRSMDPSLEEAAQVCGLTKVQTALRITAPLLAPAILSGAVLAFTIAVGLFGTPMVLGWSRQILLLTSRIWIASQAVPPDYGVMAVLSLYLIVLSILATAAQRSVLARRSYVTVTGKGFRPRPIDLGRLSALTFTIATVIHPCYRGARFGAVRRGALALHVGRTVQLRQPASCARFRRCLGHHENERADLDCGRDIGNRAGARRLLGGIAHPPPRPASA
jgi:iron(III) transport system permease protein